MLTREINYLKFVIEITGEGRRYWGIKKKE